MADWKFTYQKMIDYLKGNFSNKQQHELERNVMQDAFDEDAFDGLQELEAEMLEKDIAFLEQQLDKRTKEKSPFYFSEPLRIAASLFIVFGLGILLYQFTKPKEPGYEFVVSPEFKKETNHEIVDSETVEEEFIEAEIPQVVYEEVKEKESINYSVKGSSDVVTNDIQEKPKAVSSAKKIEVEEEISEEAPTIVYEKVVVEQENEMITESPKAVSKVSKAKPEVFKDVVSESSNLWKGTVTDESGNPLPGVNITIAGTDNGVVTDFDGDYEIEAPKDAKLEAVYLGFDSTEFDYEKSKKIILTEDLAALEEVVVVGYGTAKKRVFATILKNADLGVAEVSQSSAVNKALSKRAQGVRITSSPKLEQDSDEELKLPNVYTKAIPPQGSEAAFKNWVIAQLDPSKFEVGEIYKIATQFTVAENGEITDFKVISKTKSAIKKQFKQAILNAEKWQPALNNGKPVQEFVELEFFILAE